MLVKDKLTVSDVLSNLQSATFHRDVPKCDGLAIQVEQLRQMWTDSDREARDVIEQAAYVIEDQIVNELSRLSQERDAYVKSWDAVALADEGYFLKTDNPSATSAHWDTWNAMSFMEQAVSKQDTFIKRNFRKVGQRLYCGQVSISPVSVASNGNEMIEFRCQHAHCTFRGRHYGGWKSQVELIIARVLAHSYQH